MQEGWERVCLHCHSFIRSIQISIAVDDNPPAAPSQLQSTLPAISAQFANCLYVGYIKEAANFAGCQCGDCVYNKDLRLNKYECGADCMGPTCEKLQDELSLLL